MPELKTVTAYVAWGIYADYDGNAPDTQDLLMLATEELAQELVDLFNQNPQYVTLAFVDGWEHCKKYALHQILLLSPDAVAWTKEEAFKQADLDEAEIRAAVA